MHEQMNRQTDSQPAIIPTLISFRSYKQPLNEQTYYILCNLLREYKNM